LLFLKAKDNDPQCDAKGYNQYGPHSAVDGDYFNFASTSGDAAYAVYVDPGETRHWWRVDLQSSQNVAVVRVWARVGCDLCIDRMLNFEVIVGDSAVLSENSACATGLPDPEILLDVQCPVGTRGRYVFLALPAGTDEFFNFAEVEIYRDYFNLARACDGGACTTSMDGAASHGAWHGNDGDYDSWFHSALSSFEAGESAHWWRVDLGSSKSIGMVRVHNRRDCCPERVDGFAVHVGDSATLADNPTCASNVAAPQVVSYKASFVDVPCNARGRYVFISLPIENHFHLAEVEVFAAGFSDLSNRCVLSIDDCIAGVVASERKRQGGYRASIRNRFFRFSYIFVTDQKNSCKLARIYICVVLRFPFNERLLLS
jgi:hypothetical protein